MAMAGDHEHAARHVPGEHAAQPRPSPVRPVGARRVALARRLGDVCPRRRDHLCAADRLRPGAEPRRRCSGWCRSTATTSGCTPASPSSPPISAGSTAARPRPDDVPGGPARCDSSRHRLGSSHIINRLAQLPLCAVKRPHDTRPSASPPSSSCSPRRPCRARSRPPRCAQAQAQAPASAPCRPQAPRAAPAPAPNWRRETAQELLLYVEQIGQEGLEPGRLCAGPAARGDRRRRRGGADRGRHADLPAARRGPQRRLGARPQPGRLAHDRCRRSTRPGSSGCSPRSRAAAASARRSIRCCRPIPNMPASSARSPPRRTTRPRAATSSAPTWSAGAGCRAASAPAMSSSTCPPSPPPWSTTAG